MKKGVKNKKGQIWVETVVYTLIGLVIIGAVLAIAKPKIDEIKDRMVITQTIDAMKSLNKEVNEVKQVTGMKRVPEVRFQKGEFIVSGKEDTLYWILDDSHAAYSQPGILVPDGELRILTSISQKTTVILFLNYSGKLDITYNGKDEEKIIQQAPTPYLISIENVGMKSGKPNIDFSIG